MGALAIPIDGRQSETALLVQRGVGRLMRSLGHAVLTEMPLASGRRADLVALAADGSIWIVEIKSCVADYRSDRKWPAYRRHCDRLFFACTHEVPREIFAEDAGLIVADAFGAGIVREAPEHRMAPATRRAMTLRFGRLAAARLHGLHDPGSGFGEIE
ncbi:MmcB family DNA repair protein [Lutibaculum baratangense]|uniref:Transcription elongation factor n=1 Tax=Lutibaculum baratangense AMV1 TaxID=631454 RepID=V4R157_9HYPH|nr:MmcB family DNA repair protein [Lutibaculum baratangense]ESR25727.1 hypothetical protein N177_1560 [Lutibaculum baratangense AMV1]